MFVYLVRNRVSARCYVGITSNTIEDRWKLHCYDAFDRDSRYPLHRALRKHGVESFYITTLAEPATWNDACELEKKFIIEHQSHISLSGYNQTWGGDGILGWRHTDDAKSAIGNAHKGMKRSTSTCKKISQSLKGKKAGEKHHLFGIGHSEASKKKMSETRKGMPQPWKQKKVEQLNEMGEVLAVYSSVAEATKATGITGISACCRGRVKSVKGTWWRYVVNAGEH